MIELTDKEYAVISNSVLKLEQAIQRVRELHYPMPLQAEDCAGCEYYYPCPTIKALDGEQ